MTDYAPDRGAIPAHRVSRRRVLATIGGSIVLAAGAAAGVGLDRRPGPAPRPAPRYPGADPAVAAAEEQQGAATADRAVAFAREVPGHASLPYPVDKPLFYIEDDDKAIALTIDDGPDPVYTPQVLALLQQYQVTATFSMIGTSVNAYPHLARSVAEAGHRIANHTWTHADLPTLKTPAVHDQIAQATDAITTATGVQPGLFRAPYGAWSPAVIAECERAQMIPLDWSVDPRDWARPGVASIVSNIMKNTQPGSIILEHDGGGDRSQTVAALRIVLPELLHQGYKFQTP
jgi:peptidoglycan/xylan/chitin deacetylase (PgdA/CDA1 family)